MRNYFFFVELRDLFHQAYKVFFLINIKITIFKSLLFKQSNNNDEKKNRDRHFTQGFIELIPSLICHYKNVAFQNVDD